MHDPEEAKVQEDSSLDPVALDPDKFDIRVENKRVRVLEARIAPGQGHGMHWHPEHLIYTLFLQGPRYIHRWKHKDDRA